MLKAELNTRRYPIRHFIDHEAGLLCIGNIQPVKGLTDALIPSNCRDKITKYHQKK